MVRIETEEQDGLVASLQLTLHIVVFSTAVCLQCQTACTPTVVSWCETGATLDQRYQQSRPNRTDIGKLAKQFRRAMLAALPLKTI